MAFLVQIILPLYRNDGRRFEPELLKRVRGELRERFGGLTAYTRTPAEGTWQDDQGRTRREDVVIVEVMTDTLDRQWWSDYATELARRFQQEELVVRAMQFEDLTKRSTE
jgi:hypothetical protein